jgi:hypothetical protein
MADQKAVSLSPGGPGAEVTIYYNDVNGRIGNVEWLVQAPAVKATITIWNTAVSITTPVIERTEGPGSGAEAVPGNQRMVTIVDPEIGTYIGLPPNIIYVFNIEYQDTDAE